MESKKIAGEIKKEGWVQFQRIPCKNGFIDRWMGDMANNPNNKSKSAQNLNASTTYFRLNGTGQWMNHRDFINSMSMEIGSNHDKETAEKIWHRNLRSDVGIS